MPTYAMKCQSAADTIASAAVPAGRIAEDRPTLKARDEDKMAMCDGVIDIMAALFDIPGRELRRPGRSALGITRVRQIAMYVSHVVLKMNMTEVGRGFGRDRTTVMHACHIIEDLRDDAEFEQVVAMAERIAKAAFRT